MGQSQVKVKVGGGHRYRVVAAGFSERANGAAHGLVGHSDESVGDLVGRELLGVALLGVPLVDLGGELGEGFLRALLVERLLLGRTEDLGEVLGEQAA
jgi:hypothetical protein